MASESIVRIVINAVDKYSGVLTGLNQGLELVGKAFTGLSTVATTSFGAITTGLESVKDGGDFLELRNQFESLARSFGADGQKIIDIFDEIGQGTIKASDKVKLASKAVASGLSGEEIKQAVEYTKKWTEATGGDFEQMSQSVFEAFSSGKFSILKQMGLMVDKTTSATDVLDQMRTSMVLFSDTGLNVADSMGAIATSADDFSTYFKAAIANSDALQQALDYLAKAADGFVESFDYESVTQFFDTVLRASAIAFDALVETFSGAGSAITDVFNKLRTEAGMKEFFQAIGKGAASAYDAFATFADGAGNAASLVVGGFGNMVKLVGQGFQELKYLAASAVAAVSDVVNKGVASWAQSILQFISSAPDLSAYVPGIASISEAMLGLIETSAKSQKMYQGFKDAALNDDSWGKTIEGWGEGMESFALGLDSARAKAVQTGKDLKKNLEDGFKDFEISAKKPFISDEIVNKTADQGERIRELLRQQRDKQDAAEEQTNQKKLEREEKAAKASAERQQREQEQALRSSLKAISDLEEKLKKSPGYAMTVDEKSLLASKSKIASLVSDLDKEAKKSKLSLALDAVADPTKIKQLRDEIDKLNIKDGKLTIKADTEKQKPAQVQIQLLPGPKFFQELIESMIVMLKGERVPLAFTAVPS